MRLVDIRNKLKEEYKDVVIFMKYSNFYRVFDDDCYISYYKNYFYKKELMIILFDYDIIVELEKLLNLINRDKLNKLREKYER